MAQTSKEIIYVGTYSQNNSEGIYVLEFDRENLTTTTVQTIHDKESPTFLALHPNKKFLYAAYREGKDAKDEAGTVIAYSIAPDTGKLTKINEVSSVGASPCHISVDPTGNVVFLSHYKGGNLSTFKILENGGVSEAASFIQHTGRSVHANQTTAHMHAMIPSKDGHWVYASDLGIDQILKYKVNNIHFSKDSQWLYASNRGQDNLVVYKVDQNTGLLETQGHVPSGGKHPRNFKVDEKGDFVFVANMETDNLAIFNIDSTTGMLKATGKNIEIPRPVFIEQLFIE